MPAPGDLVAGKYRIERQLAEGGMGVIFEATHLQLEERVAIKFLRAEIAAVAESEAVQRFMREARSSIKIRSEHVVRILDVGALESGAPYMVMELLEGQDLDQVVEQRGPLPPMEAVDFVLQACEALAEAHQRGIIHRDLKPANLFLARRADGSPCVKVLDFGISKVKAPGGAADLGITNTQAVMGSPRYMSPEQLRASKSVDARSDIWAMGIVLYELLMGVVPFDGESMTAVCAAILQDTPASMTTRPEISKELEAVVLAALAKNPEQRFASVAELAEALHPFASASGQTSVLRVTGTVRGPGSSADFSTRALGAGTNAALASEPKAAGVGLTSTSWGDAPAKTRSKGRIALIGAAAVVVVVFVGSALVYRASTKTPAAMAIVTTNGASAAGAVSAVPSGAMAPASVASASSAPESAALSTPTSPIPAASTASTAPTAPLVANRSSPHLGAATGAGAGAGAGKTVPRVNPPATTQTAAAPAATPAASSPALWNGRK